MIAASGLRKRYGPTAVLEDIALELAGGQCLALLGPNGSGKTTLLRILATLLRPTSGRLTIGGVDALRDPERARAFIGMVGHGSYVYEDLTALENVRFWTGMGGGGAGQDRLLAALHHVELGAAAHGRVRTLSRGLRRGRASARLLGGDAERLAG